MDTSGMSYTCISCRVVFADANSQREHYKSDWHRYNLKRKVAEMPPVTAEVFREKVLRQRSELEEAQRDQSTHCAVCSKHFSSAKAFTNHLNSKKHKDLASKQYASKKETPSVQEPEKPDTGLDAAVPEADMDGDSDESWDGEALGLEECLFCSRISKDIELNVKHMTDKHSFFIPDIEYLVDLEGLITYLGQKVGEGRMCLWCSEKSRCYTSVKAVQQHMVDKGHCKMLHEGATIVEYDDFYDYRSSYPDFDPNEEEEMAVDTQTDIAEATDDDHQLVLPSGAVIGHRSLKIYYKQKLRPERQVAVHRNRERIQRVMSHYKSLCWTGTTGVVAQKKARDQAWMQRVRNHHHVRMGMRGNVANFKHYRDHVFGNRTSF